MKFRNKPFALIGVNTMDRKPAELKEVMEKERLDWRSFADEGPIGRKWNSPPTPAFYVLDGRGIIRHRWIGHPGEQVMDAALERLIEDQAKVGD